MPRAAAKASIAASKLAKPHCSASPQVAGGGLVLGLREVLARDLHLASDVQLLAITERHALSAARLPRHQADPFDRMLVAQAQAEGVPLVGSDAAFGAYDVAVIW